MLKSPSLKSGVSDSETNLWSIDWPNEREQLLRVWPSIKKDLLSMEGPAIPGVFEKLDAILEYTCLGGKYTRGITTVMSYKFLMDFKLTDDGLYQARVLGWCIELMQAYFLVLDDIMDHSETRRGKPCWYMVNGIGLSGINDGLLIENCIYWLLRHYFADHPSYTKLVDVFHQVTLQTVFGQMLDTSFDYDPTDRFSRLTGEMYDAIVSYKTAHYSFYLPVALALHFVGVHDKEAHLSEKRILLEIGRYFQVQDDYLDCYGDPEITGKIGTDIQEFKCSWLVIEALKMADVEQRDVIYANYGVDNPDKIEAVKNVYDKLDLPGVYSSFEEETYERIGKLVSQHDGVVPQILYRELVARVFKRRK